MMKTYKLAIVFTQSPFGSATAREGLDALLAATAFCDENDIAAFFLFDGVYNLIQGQQPAHILQKDHIATFKLLDLYDISNCFVCKESVRLRQLQHATWTLPHLQFLSRQALFEQLHQAQKILTF